MPKCIFSKATEDLNTSVTVETSLGPVRVYLADSMMDKTLQEVHDAVFAMIEQAQSLAETFDFKLEDAIGKGGMLTLDRPSAPVARAPVASRAASNGMVMQEIKPRTQSSEEGEEEVFDNTATAIPPPGIGSVIITESETGLKKEEKTRVTSPGGRSFAIPRKIKDDTGETTIMIDTESEARFRTKQAKDEAAAKQGGANNTSYQESYGVEFQPCKLCAGPNHQPTGMVSGKTCPKCKGSMEIIITR